MIHDDLYIYIYISLVKVIINVKTCILSCFGLPVLFEQRNGTFVFVKMQNRMRFEYFHFGNDA